jgi:hypothetical protein
VKTKARDIVAEIASKVPRDTHRNRPWWERVPPEHQPTLDAIHAAWHAGTFGSRKRPAARVISAAIAEFGISIGEQGVTAWLELPPRS